MTCFAPRNTRAEHVAEIETETETETEIETEIETEAAFAAPVNHACTHDRRSSRIIRLRFGAGKISCQVSAESAMSHRYDKPCP